MANCLRKGYYEFRLDPLEKSRNILLLQQWQDCMLKSQDCMLIYVLINKTELRVIRAHDKEITL